MRPIKFRCYIKSTKELLPVTSLVQMNDEEGMRVFPQGYAKNFLTSKGDIELMQFTGLLDKNGKEIFEGDIVRSDSGFITTVEFVDNGFYIIGQFPFDPSDLENYEIIGNIYSNPELLGN